MSSKAKLCSTCCLHWAQFGKGVFEVLQPAAMSGRGPGGQEQVGTAVAVAEHKLVDFVPELSVHFLSFLHLVKRQDVIFVSDGERPPVRSPRYAESIGLDGIRLESFTLLDVP